MANTHSFSLFIRPNPHLLYPTLSSYMLSFPLHQHLHHPPLFSYSPSALLPLPLPPPLLLSIQPLFLLLLLLPLPTPFSFSCRLIPIPSSSTPPLLPHVLFSSSSTSTPPSSLVLLHLRPLTSSTSSSLVSAPLYLSSHILPHSLSSFHASSFHPLLLFIVLFALLHSTSHRPLLPLCLHSLPSLLPSYSHSLNLFPTISSSTPPSSTVHTCIASIHLLSSHPPSLLYLAPSSLPLSSILHSPSSFPFPSLFLLLFSSSPILPCPPTPTLSTRFLPFHPQPLLPPPCILASLQSTSYLPIVPPFFTPVPSYLPPSSMLQSPTSSLFPSLFPLLFSFSHILPCPTFYFSHAHPLSPISPIIYFSSLSHSTSSPLFSLQSLHFTHALSFLYHPYSIPTLLSPSHTPLSHIFPILIYVFPSLLLLPYFTLPRLLLFPCPSLISQSYPLSVSLPCFTPHILPSFPFSPFTLPMLLPSSTIHTPPTVFFPLLLSCPLSSSPRLILRTPPSTPPPLISYSISFLNHPYSTPALLSPSPLMPPLVIPSPLTPYPSIHSSTAHIIFSILAPICFSSFFFMFLTQSLPSFSSFVPFSPSLSIPNSLVLNTRLHSPSPNTHFISLISLFFLCTLPISSSYAPFTSLLTVSSPPLSSPPPSRLPLASTHAPSSSSPPPSIFPSPYSPCPFSLPPPTPPPLPLPPLPIPPFSPHLLIVTPFRPCSLIILGKIEE